MSEFDKKYKFGFSTEIEMENFPEGINEEVVVKISKKKNEPQWMLDFRLKSFKIWKNMKEPHWGVKYDPVDYQKMSYFAQPKKAINDLNELDPEILKTYEKLGIPLEEQKWLNGIAVDAVFDSVSLITTHKKILEEKGIIFCSLSEAVLKYPEMVQKYLATVVPAADNFFAALNSAVWTDGSFVLVPKGVKCPMELSTYFRINSSETGQFERTLIICEEDSSLIYNEGCSSPSHKKYQLHAAVVELIALKNADIKYTTIQNWYIGKNSKEGIYNFVTKRGLCKGENSKISWTQVEFGASKTWKYPSCILLGDNSKGEFFSVALTHSHMEADTGSKMIHIGKNTRSKIISKAISLDSSTNIYRGLVKILPKAEGSMNYTQCDSLLIGDKCQAFTYPKIENMRADSILEHEASASKISEEQLFYLKSRGYSQEEAMKLILSGYAQEVFKHLSLEFAVEAKKLLEMKLENSVG